MANILSFEVQRLPALNIWSSKESELGPCTGYLDGVLTTFEKHQQPFIILGPFASRWHGCNVKMSADIGLLVRQASLITICNDLLSSGEWSLCRNPYVKEGALRHDKENTTAIREIWLVSQKDNLSGAIGIKYLRFWPEELYQLSVADCKKYEVPDLILEEPFVLEEEYCRDANHQFGPREFSLLNHERRLLPSVSYRCKWIKRSIPIFVPTIEDHLHALLEQALNGLKKYEDCGNQPTVKIRQYIKHHKWNWVSASQWLLSEKVSTCHSRFMKSLLNSQDYKLVRRQDAVTKRRKIRKSPSNPSMPTETDVAEMPTCQRPVQELTDTLKAWGAKSNSLGGSDLIWMYEGVRL